MLFVESVSINVEVVGKKCAESFRLLVCHTCTCSTGLQVTHVGRSSAKLHNFSTNRPSQLQISYRSAVHLA